MSGKAPVGRDGNWPRLRLEDMSDIELLRAFDDACDNEGKATSREAAAQLDEGEDAAMSVARRFTWYKAWGLMERDEETGRWSFTPEGRRMYETAQLSKRDRERLERNAHAAVLAAGDIFGGSLDRAQLKMLRRQLRHQEASRW